MSDPTPTPEPTPTPSPAPTPAAWYAGADDETVGYFQNRGWDKKTAAEAAIEAAKAHRSAEKLIGAPADQIIRLPKPDATDAERNAFHERLGRPSKADAYDFKDIKFADGTELDSDYASFLKETAFKLNLPADAGKEWARATIAQFEKTQSAENSTTQAKNQTELTALKKSWGTNFQGNNFIATQAAEKLGLDAAMLKAMADHLGPGKVMQTMLSIGQKLGEDRYIAGTGATAGGILTKEQAKAKLADLKTDKVWRDRYFKGERGAVAEFDSLIELSVGQPA